MSNKKSWNEIIIGVFGNSFAKNLKLKSPWTPLRNFPLNARDVEKAAQDAPINEEYLSKVKQEEQQAFTRPRCNVLAEVSHVHKAIRKIIAKRIAVRYAQDAEKIGTKLRRARTSCGASFVLTKA